ncbi:inorganic phosphate cotransporter [Apis mellifera caucasica]|uniref:Inorganic phosphate cotransporter n=1 Tax=Apis mellifera TaxID=7460 RepID=A0A7M7G034_APIME|nr:putative inorganic phosphate cotransporter [Apis mellifera]KAG6798613.1 inorganic phosphate cotransporter [Apis mellifera caucasica]KAG9437222.1 inorganic phosphate cotransporter [Apis mellifera carnica]|eukprot:XP_001122304.3 putative inorganic phosphate cotransporter [Apis mellifera]
MVGYVRYLFAIMICIANMIVYGLKVNIAVAVVGMVKHTDEISDASDECDFVPIAEVIDIEGPFEWTSTQRGLAISIYFAGYLVGMFPCGYFADRFNSRNALLICVLGNAILTLIVPVVAPVLWLLYVTRFVMGVVSAPNLPIVAIMVGRWVVYEEKSLWFGIIYSGTSIGTVISILTSGMILHALGWEAVFYIHGALSLIWCVVFLVFFRESPETQYYISEEERHYIVTSYGHRGLESVHMKVPWKAIFTSVPFLALIYTNTFGNFAWYFLLTQLPMYMNKILRFDIQSNAILSCLPYLLAAIMNPILGRFLDWGRARNYWTQTGGRKIAVGMSCIPPSLFLLIIAYIGCYRVIAVILLMLSVMLGGSIFVGHLANHNDLAPNYAGILMGITNTPGTISAFILPAIVGALTEAGHTMARWRYVFWITIIAQMSAFVVFTIFGSAEIQEWNYYGVEAEEN